jgi:hypothetical protein
MTAARATTWTEEGTNVVMLEGPGVAIDLDRTRMTADRAVVWIRPTKGTLLQEQSAEIALLGNYTLDQQGQVRQSGERLLVTAQVRGVVRVTANDRRVGRAENSELYQARRRCGPLPPTASGEDIDNWLTAPGLRRRRATTQPSKARYPVAFSADRWRRRRSRTDTRRRRRGWLRSW